MSQTTLKTILIDSSDGEKIKQLHTLYPVVEGQQFEIEQQIQPGQREIWTVEVVEYIDRVQVLGLEVTRVVRVHVVKKQPYYNLYN